MKNHLPAFPRSHGGFRKGSFRMSGLKFLVSILSGPTAVRRRLERGRLGLGNLLLQALIPLDFVCFAIQAGSPPFYFWKHRACVYGSLRCFQGSNPTEKSCKPNSLYICKHSANNSSF